MLLMVLLVVVSLAVVTIIMLSQMSYQARTQATTKLEAIAELKRAQIDQWLDTVEMGVDLFLSDLRRQAGLSAYVADPSSGTEAIHVRVLQDAAEAVSGIVEFFVYDREGRIQASSDTSQIGVSVADQPYFATSVSRSYRQPPTTTRRAARSRSSSPNRCARATSPSARWQRGWIWRFWPT
ncbi:MAG: hypothetical protein M5R40_28700 [Anaerolineae bacterium]|nr:hypothetical protein [Anaerolineae bacterium]